MNTPSRGPYELLHNYPRLRRPPKPHPKFGWPDEAKMMLRLLWAGKMVALEIADKLSKAFDYKVTKNMVIGMAQRLNLALREPGQHTPRPSNRPRKPKPLPSTIKPRPAARKPQTLTIRAGRSIAAHVVTKCSEVMDLPPEIPSATAKTILELTNETCRWPIGDPGKPEFCFCGQKGFACEICGARPVDCDKAMPYCPVHSRIAYPRSNGKPFVPNTGGRHYNPALLHAPNDADFG